MSNKSSSLIASDSKAAGVKDVAIVRKDFLLNGNSFLRTATILGLLILAQTAWVRWMWATNGPTVDFFTFWSVPQVLRQEAVANIYSPESQVEMGSRVLLLAQTPGTSDHQREATAMSSRLYHGRIDATGSPLLYALVGVLSSGDYPTDQKRFLLASMVCLVASILFLSRLLQFKTLAVALVLVFIFWNYEPFLSDINAGNVNEFQLLGVVLFIFFMARSQPLLAGLTIGAATAFKPTTLMILALSVIAGLADRQYEQLLYMLLGCFAGFASSVMAGVAYFQRPAMWLQFLYSLPKTLNGNQIYTLEAGNFSLSALLFGPTSRWSAAIPAVLLGTFTWLFFSTRPGKRSSTVPPKQVNAHLRLDTACCLGGCGAAVMLLSSPLAWVHYYLLLLPLCLYLVFSEDEKDKAGWGRVRRALTLGVPYVPLVLFSVSVVQVVKDARWVCILMISATTLAMVLTSYRIWELRKKSASVSEAKAPPIGYGLRAG